MFWKNLPLFLFVLLNATLNAQEKDTIYLQNGQIFIGKIKNASLGEITIDDVDMRVLQVKAYKVKRLSAVDRFRIETTAKEIYYGRLRPSEKEGYANIVLDDGMAIETDLVELTLVISLEKRFFTRLNGNLSAGFSYTKSNSLGQFNFAANATYATEKFSYQLSLSTISSIDSGVLSRDRGDLGLFVAYNFNYDWFAAAGINSQRNLELSIARRYQQLIGGGHNFYTSDIWRIMGISGVNFSEETSTSGTTSGLLVEIPIVLKLIFFKYRNPNIQVSSTNSLYNGITQKGRLRVDSNTSFSWELVKYFYLTINPYATFDNQPPEGNSNFDFGIAVGISYKF